MRTLGWLFIVFGLTILGRDVARWMEFGYFQPTPLGQVWYMIDRSSLNTAQAAIERHVAIWLWQDAIGVMLLWPSWITLPVVGCLCFLFGGLFRGSMGDRRPN